MQKRKNPPALRAAVAGVMLAVAVVAAGCGSEPQEVAQVSLDGTHWRAIDIDGEPTVGGSEPTIEFAGTRVKGSGGCNAFGGSFTVDGTAITVGDIGSTLKLCEGEVGEIETRFMRALLGAQSADVDDAGELRLTGVGGAIHFVPARGG